MLSHLRKSTRCFLWACWLAIHIVPGAGGLVAQTGAQDNAGKIGLDTYRAELDRLSQAVTAMQEHPEEARALRDSLPKKWTVSDQGTSYEVSTARLADDLDQLLKDPHNGSYRASLKRRIVALQAEADAFGSEASSSSDARQKLQKILGRKEFRIAEGSTWLERQAEKFARWWSSLKKPSVGHVNFSPSLGRTLVWAMITAVCLALAFALWKLITRTRENLDLNLSGGEQFHKRSREWVTDALANARRGDYRSAIRCAYWAAVFRLEELGRWAPNRTLTPREYLRQLPADHFQRPSLADLTQRFELTWYGYAAATARDFDQVTEQLEKLGCLAPSAAATKKS
ncbi:MAG: hypothetical protein DMG67_01540 [Acidobacteria bacterium]|nr:MAG: hypothetical protein DMG67_01540 [Acidobacteriota bacterium]